LSNVILISYDNGSHIPFFPLNLFYLTGALRGAGHDVRILWQDLDHFPDKDITGWLDKWDDFTNRKPVDVVGLGFVAGYYQYAKAKRISEAVNKSSRRREINFVLGGHGPAADPAYFIERCGCDTVVVGDGESAIVECANNNLRGIIQGVPTEKDESPAWLYPAFQVPFYRLIRWPTSERTDFCFPILSSRGCKWHCSFCYRMRDGFHERDVKAIIDEIRYLYKNFSINHFQFADELLMSSEKRVEEICNALLGLRCKIKWDCNGRLNYAFPETLTLMRKAGCEYINYGIESLNQSILNSMGKGLTVDRIYQGVEDTLRSNISPGLNFIWGFPGDTVENLKAAADFIIKYDPGRELRTIRPVTPYPGTPLFKKAVEMGLIKDTADFYENLHKNSDLFTVNFMDIPTELAHWELYRTNKRLMISYQEKRLKRTLGSARDMYVEGKPFRGYREV
jgi:anaerobic magnesium-protoporphyrin IX monomethyl ester cyclase